MTTLQTFFFATHLRTRFAPIYLNRNIFGFLSLLFYTARRKTPLRKRAYGILLTIIIVSGARCRYFGEVPRETVGAHRWRCVQRNRQT